MSRSGSGVYSLPAGYSATTGQTATAIQHNTPLEDLETDMNTARPVVAGGTGAATAADARDNLNVGATVLSKAAAYTALVADRSKLIRSTATMTLSLTAAATLGDGWFINVIADTGTLTIDPNGAETVDGSATIDITEGQSSLIYCDGTSFYTTALAVATTTTVGGVEKSTTAESEGGTEADKFPDVVGVKAAIEALQTNVRQEKQVAASDATIDFTLATGADEHVFQFAQVIPATDNVEFQIKASDDSLATFENIEVLYVGNGSAAGSATAATCPLAKGVGSGATENGVSGEVVITQLSGGYAHIRVNLIYVDAIPGDPNIVTSAAVVQTTTALTDIQFLFGAGNVESGEFYYTTRTY